MTKPKNIKEHKGVTLRPWHENDLENLVKYANNPNIAKNMTDGFPFPYTIEKAKSFIAMANQSVPVRIFAIDLQGEAIGGIGIHPLSDIYRQNAELGYWLAEPFWGQGIISEAIRQVLTRAFKNKELHRVFARPFGSNTASQKVLEKNGFVLEGRFDKVLIKNNELQDELVYAVRRSDFVS